MELQDARMKFVQTWGALGSSWGIPRSMAQIHALLLSHKDELCAEDIMETIKLSRGNVNINLRELINWNIVSKTNKLGERREFFSANHDIWEMSKNIIQERKRREIAPIKLLLSELQQSNIKGKKVDTDHFNKLIKDLDEFVTQMDQLSDLMVKLNNNIFFKKMVKLMG